MISPLVDITTINAVESLFRGGTRDPWARQMAGELADLVVYADEVRYGLTLPGVAPPEPEDGVVPSLLLDLSRRDSIVFRAEKYLSTEPFLLRDEYLERCFEQFGSWARSNRSTLRRWMALHNEEWIRVQHDTRIQHQFSFLLDKLLGDPALGALANAIGIGERDVCYAFDLVLRYPLYGLMAGEDEHYLSHPIRGSMQLPTMCSEPGRRPPVALSFRKLIGELAPALSQNEYAALLHELRGTVREYGLHRVAPGEVDKEVIRDIAAKVALPPSLRSGGKMAAVGASLIGGLTAIPILGSVGAVAGAAVSVSAVLWTGRVPRATTRLKWLRWALEWDIEDQAAKRG